MEFLTQRWTLSPADPDGFPQCRVQQQVAYIRQIEMVSKRQLIWSLV